MYDDFEKRFDYALKGDFKKYFEKLQDTDVWGWCKAQQSAVEHRVQRTAIAVGGLCGLAGFVIGWLMFGG